MTSNFQNNPIGELDRLHRLQPDRPLMVMEFWTGWFDIWGENHNTLDVESKLFLRLKMTSGAVWMDFMCMEYRLDT